MSKSKWTEERIEDLLKQMPTIHDSRHPREIFVNISGRLPRKKKPTIWLTPGFASFAAILLLIILLPNLSPVEETAQKSKRTEQQDSTDMVDNNAASLKFANKKQESVLYRNEDVGRTAVYNEDIVGKELLIYGIPDINAQNIVQVSVLIETDDSKTWLQQLIDSMPMLTEEAWGLSEFYPINGVFSQSSDQKTINLNVPIDHQYGMGSTAESLFCNSLITSFLHRKEIAKISFTTDQKPGIFLGNGSINEINLGPYRDKGHAYFLMDVNGQNRPLLVPLQESIDTLEKALESMKDEVPTHGLRASVPSELQVTEITVKNDTVILSFKKDATIVGTPEMDYAVEAILLTVKEFGYKKVKLDNLGVPNIGPFRIDTEIEVPVAANKMEL